MRTLAPSAPFCSSALRSHGLPGLRSGKAELHPFRREFVETVPWCVCFCRHLNQRKASCLLSSSAHKFSDFFFSNLWARSRAHTTLSRTRILQNIKSCGLSVPRVHESPSSTAAGRRRRREAAAIPTNNYTHACHTFCVTCHAKKT